MTPSTIDSIDRLLRGVAGEFGEELEAPLIVGGCLVAIPGFERAVRDRLLRSIVLDRQDSEGRAAMMMNLVPYMIEDDRQDRPRSLAPMTLAYTQRPRHHRLCSNLLAAAPKPALGT
jgi:hypothetical protein